MSYTPYRRKSTPARINFQSRPAPASNGRSGRVMYVGDHHQAIYGFSGSNSQSMSVFADELQNTSLGLTKLPLTVTRRCPVLVTALARTIVPDFECLPHVKLGSVCFGDSILEYRPTYDNFYGYEIIKYPEEVIEVPAPEYYEDQKPQTWTTPGFCKDTTPKPGDMVLCRVNAPLVQMAYGMIRENKPVKIQGRDIGASLANKIKKLVANDASTAVLLQRLEGYKTRQLLMLAKQYGDGTPRFDEARARLEDEITCITYLCEGLVTVQEVFSRIQVLFADVEKGNTGNFTLLSSVHRAKGLEASTVRIISPELLPHPMAKLPWQREQEQNLKYVAITRSTDVLHIH